jgi:protein arginine N-methyltransferase 1
VRPSLILINSPTDIPIARSETVLYLGDMITVKANDSVSGTISIAPNATNPRDLDIVLDYKVDADGTGDKREYRMA